MCYSVFSFWHKKAQRFSSSVLCVVGDFCSHGSSNLFSIGKYPFSIYKIELKNFSRKPLAGATFARLARASTDSLALGYLRLGSLRERGAREANLDSAK